MNDAPYQIKRSPGTEPGTYTFQLIHVPTGKLVQGEYRQRSPIPHKLMLANQARLNSAAFFDAKSVRN